MFKENVIYDHLVLELRALGEMVVRNENDKSNDGISFAGLPKAGVETVEDLETVARKKGIELPLNLLCDRFSLDEVEKRILLISLFPSFIPDFLDQLGVHQVVMGHYAILPHILDRVGLFDSEHRGMYRRYLSNDSKLIRYGLIETQSHFSESHSDFYICGSRRVHNFLMGNDDLDIGPGSVVRILKEDRQLVSSDTMESSSGGHSEMLSLIQDSQDDARIPIVMLTGPSKTEKDRFLVNHCDKYGWKVLELNFHSINFASSVFDRKSFVMDLQRELKLLGGVLLLRLNDPGLKKSIEFTNEKIETEDLIIEIIAGLSGPIFIESEKKIRFSDEVRRKDVIELYELNFPSPDLERRANLWRDSLNGISVDSSSVDPEKLAARYRFTEEQIRMAVEDAKMHAQERSEFNGSLTQEDIHLSCRRRMQVNFPGTVKKIDPDFQWEDLILSDDHIVRLKELAYHLRHSDTVYDDWGFQGKSTASRGIHVLFSGHSGTGKTMAAGVIAKETGLDLYRIDLAGVVNKYIGETEKNLSRIFDEAHNSQAILFFDEADALFGKRSEVKDAKDRYANIEVAYLLQKMEEYNGMTILATNLASNLDDAFRRRLHFMIEFPMPDKSTARKLWERAFPKKAPVANDIDLDFLSNELQFSGGNIKNVALNAAFFAAEEGSDICMRHVMRSVRREYQKTGKPFGKEDMKKYYDMAIQEVN